ncbi:MAG: hypothetical protein IJ188_08435 [Clostridia bacterium]|nr:hypothetical protein [Clostridia bacterium]
MNSVAYLTDDTQEICREEAEASTYELWKLVTRAFGGQPAMLVNNLVDSGDMSVDELQSLLDSIRNKN